QFSARARRNSWTEGWGVVTIASAPPFPGIRSAAPPAAFGSGWTAPLDEVIDSPCTVTSLAYAAGAVIANRPRTPASRGIRSRVSPMETTNRSPQGVPSPLLPLLFGRWTVVL